MIVAPNRSIASAFKNPEIINEDWHDFSFDLGYEERITHPTEKFQKHHQVVPSEGVLDVSFKKRIVITEDSEHFLALDLKIKNRSSFDIKEFSIAKLINSKT